MKIIAYILLFAVISCKPVQNNDANRNYSLQENTDPKMMFCFFNATKNADNTFKIVLNDKRIVNEKLKGFFSKKIPTNEFLDKHFLVSFLNNNTNIVQLQIENPLIEEVEFVNEEGNFEKKTIYHEQKDFVIRIPIDNPINNITFELLTEIEGKVNRQIISQINLE